MKALNVLLFDGFTEVNALGPAEAPVPGARRRAKMLRNRVFFGCGRARG